MPDWKKFWLRHARAAASPAIDARQRGQNGEELAARELLSRGYRIIERNWRPGRGQRGEIDCIAWTRDERGEKVLAFVEVKTRRNDAAGAPQEAVTPAKQRQIARLAHLYVSLHRHADITCRFDVMEVWLDDDAPPRCRLHCNAFECDG